MKKKSLLETCEKVSWNHRLVAEIKDGYIYYLPVEVYYADGVPCSYQDKLSPDAHNSFIFEVLETTPQEAWASLNLYVQRTACALQQPILYWDEVKKVLTETKPAAFLAIEKKIAKSNAKSNE